MASKWSQSGGLFGKRTNKMGGIRKPRQNRQPTPSPTKRNNLNNNIAEMAGQKEKRLPDVHLGAAYIHNVKEWHKYKDNLEMVFEIYALLDREVHTRDNGRMELVLRDQTDNIIASYYEIDQSLLKVKPNTWIKVACVWRYWGLQAVRVQMPEHNFAIELQGKALLAQKQLFDKLSKCNAPVF